jgi:Bacterial Ig-like domain (group 3)
VTFTATVSGSGGVPAGTVTFYNGTTSLGTGTLAGGVATLTTSFSTAGTETITATYGGDANFTGSTSAPLTETVVIPGFTATVSPASLTIPFARSGTVTFTITPQGGFTGPVNFACGTLPAYFSCNFGTPSVSLTSPGATTNTLTINTALTAKASVTRAGVFAGRVLTATVFLLPGFAGLLAGRRRRGRKPANARIWMLALLFIWSIWSGGVAFMSGCGDGDHQAPAGNYTIPVNLTSTSAASQTINVVVMVE